jgi:predicted ATPase
MPRRRPRAPDGDRAGDERGRRVAARRAGRERKPRSPAPGAVKWGVGVKVLAENYRVLRKVEWDLPKGVCALVGPNGSGKTTLLDVLEVLKESLINGVPSGIIGRSGLEGLRNLYAKNSDKVALGIAFDSLHWTVHLSIGGRATPLVYGESVLQDGRQVINRQPDKPTSIFRDGKEQTVGDTSTLKILVQDSYSPRSPWDGTFHPPLDALVEYRLYPPYHLESIRNNGSEISADHVLGTNGANIFSVLRTWRDKHATKDRYEFVIEGLRDAFPDVFAELDFEQTKTLSGRIIRPGSTESLPIRFAPSGWLTALLHLAAVASTAHGGIVAIDEPENGLHPYAVKRILGAMREWADGNDLTVLLATHSPMLLDQFKEEPEHLFVMEPGRDVLPVRLDEVRDRAWLAQFSLGDLYKHGDFGAPNEGAPAPP